MQTSGQAQWCDGTLVTASSNSASPILKVRFKMSNGAMYFVRAASLLIAGSTMTPWPCAEHLKRQHLCDKVWDRYVCYGGLCH